MNDQTGKPRVTRISAYALIEDAGSLLLCRLSRSVRNYQGWWTLPGGGLEFGEHPEEGMVREVEEETGFRVRPTGLLGVHSFTHDGEVDDFHGIQIIYAAEIVDGILRHELEGTTDYCQWHGRNSLESLDVVSLVETALSL